MEILQGILHSLFTMLSTFFKTLFSSFFALIASTTFPIALLVHYINLFTATTTYIFNRWIVPHSEELRTIAITIAFGIVILLTTYHTIQELERFGKWCLGWCREFVESIAEVIGDVLWYLGQKVFRISIVRFAARLHARVLETVGRVLKLVVRKLKLFNVARYLAWHLVVRSEEVEKALMVVLKEVDDAIMEDLWAPVVMLLKVHDCIVDFVWRMTVRCFNFIDAILESFLEKVDDAVMALVWALGFESLGMKNILGMAAGFLLSWLHEGGIPRLVICFSQLLDWTYRLATWISGLTIWICQQAILIYNCSKLCLKERIAKLYTFFDNAIRKSATTLVRWAGGCRIGRQIIWFFDRMSPYLKVAMAKVYAIPISILKYAIRRCHSFYKTVTSYIVPELQRLFPHITTFFPELFMTIFSWPKQHMTLFKEYLPNFSIQTLNPKRFLEHHGFSFQRRGILERVPESPSMAGVKNLNLLSDVQNDSPKKWEPKTPSPAEFREYRRYQLKVSEKAVDEWIGIRNRTKEVKVEVCNKCGYLESPGVLKCCIAKRMTEGARHHGS